MDTFYRTNKQNKNKKQNLNLKKIYAAVVHERIYV